MHPEPLVYHIQNRDIFGAMFQDNADHEVVQTFLTHLDPKGVTFAFQETPEGWVGSYAATGHGDSFCRKLGRAIACGRLSCKRKVLWQSFGKEKPTYEDALVLADLILHEKEF